MESLGYFQVNNLKFVLLNDPGKDDLPVPESYRFFLSFRKENIFLNLSGFWSSSGALCLLCSFRGSQNPGGNIPDTKEAADVLGLQERGQGAYVQGSCSRAEGSLTESGKRNKGHGAPGHYLGAEFL